MCLGTFYIHMLLVSAMYRIAISIYYFVSIACAYIYHCPVVVTFIAVQCTCYIPVVKGGVKVITSSKDSRNTTEYYNNERYKPLVQLHVHMSRITLASCLRACHANVELVHPPQVDMPRSLAHVL